MKPKKPLPTGQPFLTILTRTFCRPAGLAACMRSIHRQTIADQIEHIIIPDYVGVAPNDAVYGTLPKYLDAIHGEYVHVLGDDDKLADDKAVENLREFIHWNKKPDVVVIRCSKGGKIYPKTALDQEFKEGDLDLCNLVVEADYFKMAMLSYSHGYVCDWGFFLTLCDAVSSDLKALDYMFAIGAEGSGRPEAVDW